jgi:hypothetical protein
MPGPAPTSNAAQAPDPLANVATLDPDKPMPKGSVTTDATLQLGQLSSAMIDARSDVYSASAAVADRSRGGVLPSRITLAAGGGYLVFNNVRGRIGCQGRSNYGPDGGSCVGGNTNLRSAGAVSGIVAHERTLFITGVFLADHPGPVPAGLDFSKAALGLSREQYEPQLGQSFFIGDGLTDTGAGSQQRFIIPAGASTLYLGFADGPAFQGNPGTYSDNTGSVALRLMQTR